MLKNKHKPLIAVTGPDTKGITLWLFTKCAIWLSGGIAQRLTPDTKVDLTIFDGFVIAGGSDINPETYGEAAAAVPIQYDVMRDALEQEVIQHAIKHKKPLLGICRGMQMLNIVMGGSLYQEAREVLEDFLPSDNLMSKIIGRRDVKIDRKSKLFSILGNRENYYMNSLHHQAINKVGKGLCVVGREENQLIQAIEQLPENDHPFLVGVQWHPELMLHTSAARRLFRALVKTAALQNGKT